MIVQSINFASVTLIKSVIVAVSYFLHLFVPAYIQMLYKSVYEYHIYYILMPAWLNLCCLKLPKQVSILLQIILIFFNVNFE